MATEIFINIKDLPEITEIANGQYIPVETNTGTHIIDFKNLLLPADNTLITATVTQNINAITTLTETVNTLSASTFATIDSTFSTLNTTYASISGVLESISDSVSKGIYNFVAKSSITIPIYNSSASNAITPNTDTSKSFSVSDLIVIPTNLYAAQHPAYVSNFDQTNGIITITGVFSKTQLAFNDANTNNLTTSDSVSGLSFSNLLNCLKLEEVTGAATETATYAVIGIKNV